MSALNEPFRSKNRRYELSAISSQIGPFEDWGKKQLLTAEGPLQVGPIDLIFFANRETALYLPLQVSLPYFMLQDATDDRFGEAVPQRWFEMRAAGLGRPRRRPMPLDFDSFGYRQRIFELYAEVPDSAIHLAVTQ